MNEILVKLEDKIKILFGKESNKEKKFSLLEIARIIDPRNKYPFSYFELALRKLEIEGTLYYEKESKTFCLFPYNLGFVQCSVLKNNVGEGLIDMPDGRKYKLEGDEANTLLSGDLIVIEPTTKRSGNRMIANFDKLVKRKNGLVVVRVDRDWDDAKLIPISDNLGYPIVLEGDKIYSYSNGDYLLVRIGELNPIGYFEAEVIKPVDIKKTPVEKLIDSKEFDDEYVLTAHMANTESANLEAEEENFTVKGVMRINKYGEGLVATKNGKTYLIKPEFFSDAFKGDIVEIRPTKLTSHGHIVSRVESVVKRNDGLIAIEVDYDKKNEVVLKPLNYNLKHKLVLPSSFDGILVPGDRFIGRIGAYPVKNVYEVEYVRSFGHKDDPDADLKLIEAEYDIVEEFTPEQNAEAYSMPRNPLPEEYATRVDHRKQHVFTIDGVRAKDRDDAVSIEELPNGNYKVTVFSSDVPARIHPGMHLWDAIMDRCTSVYMDESLNPMLPYVITKDICSLNPGVDRLTFDTVMIMDKKGHILDFEFTDGIIRSEKAMTYDAVNEILEEGKTPNGYEPYVEDLKKLNIVSKGFANWLFQQGMIDFDDIESDIEVERDENGKIVEFKAEKQRTAQRLIEYLMLAAGYCAGLYTMFPTTYRVEEAPEAGSVKAALEKIKKMGVKVVKTEDITDRKFLQRVIKSIQSQPVRTAAANQILLAMKPARIDVDGNIGHYVLGFKMVRITSPMRRAEDDIAIMQIRKQRDCLFNPETINEEMAGDHDWIKRQAELITLRQDNADKAEKDAVLLRMMKYIDDHIGESFPAMVTYVNKGGIFIKTSNGVVGKIDINDYDGDTLFFDEKKLAYRGRATGALIKIGTTLVVTALDTRREYKTINFGVKYEECKKLTRKNCIKKRS
jgi:ribonuclease R